MKKLTKLFTNIKTEENWLALQKGWRLIYTNGIRYTFEECSYEYNYEYIFFDKSKKELDDIRKQIIDNDIEFVCNSSSWALFRKDASKGEIHVYADKYHKYKILMKKYKSCMALGACYMCLGSSQIALASAVNSFFALSSPLFYLSSFMFFMAASSYKKYSLEYEDGSYADRMKKEK
jgi:hypothetical protein